MSERSVIDHTKRLMGALLRMKPKPHEDMKLGKKEGPSGHGSHANPKKNPPKSVHQNERPKREGQCEIPM